MPELYIFDISDKLLSIFSTDAEEACPFWSAQFREVLNNGSSTEGSTFKFVCPADHPDSQYAVAENQVAFQDKDGDFRLFAIRETEDSDGSGGPVIHAICEPAMLELNDEIIEDIQPTNTTADVALGDALSGTRWQVGTVASLGNNGTNFYYITATTAIQDILSTWGGELKDRITVDETGITGRFIDILTRRGADTGKTWEMDKDIISLTRAVKSYPKTALYGRGASQSTDSEGNTQKLTFANEVWSIANGDPVDKPSGQEWVGDPDALDTFGRPNTDGTKRHRFGVYDDSEQSDAATLLQDTWDALQQQKVQTENFQMDVFLLEDITGYEHEKVRLGDTTFAINYNFAKPIKVEERVISFEYDVSDPDNTGQVELGDYIDLFADDKRIDSVEQQLNNGSGIWGQVENISDTNFPDTKPPVPTNFTATGLFKIIQLVWDYDSASYIAAYEIYASQVSGFTPDSSNLVWRGKAGGYNFKADTDQQWYFQIRTINTHGTASDFTAEVSTQTVQIANKDIAPLTITNELVAEDADLDFAKIANVVITNAMLANESVDTAQIKDEAVTNAKIESLNADKIIATSLAAISADLGTITSGSITAQTSINVGTNVWIGNNLYLGVSGDTGTKKIEFFTGLSHFSSISATLNADDTTNLSLTTDSALHLGAGGIITTAKTFHVADASGQLDFTYASQGIRIFSDQGATYGDLFARNVNAGYNGDNMLHDHDNGNVSVNGAGGDLFLGYAKTTNVYCTPPNFYIGTSGLIQWDSSDLRLFQDESVDTQLKISQDNFSFKFNGTYKHIFNSDGSKVGGSIEIDNKLLGMSPIDSPQFPIEYIIFDQEVTTAGVTVQVDQDFSDAVNGKFAVFANNGVEISDKTATSFVVKGSVSKADIRLIGLRYDHIDDFWTNMEEESSS